MSPLLKYTTILADPPWPMTEAVSQPWIRWSGKRGRVAPYNLMTLEDINALQVEDLAADESHLYLWVPAGLNREGVGVACARAWGFTVVNEIVWHKPNFGMGKFPRPQHEILLVCRKGKLAFGARDIGSVQKWKQPYLNLNNKTHSAKPDAAIDMIEQVSPGPYLELFARRKRLGWDTWGDQIWQDVDLAANTST